jgi:L-seryl-tRNA(Ser) seleniumtransferase
MARNPLARALRLDKLSLAALDWTLACYLEGRADREIPVLQQLLEPVAKLEARARKLAERLTNAAGDANPVAARPDRTFVGGGSLPTLEIDTWVVTLRPEQGAAQVAARLRTGADPVLARVRDDLVLFDVRTLLEGEEVAVEKAVVAILGDSAR